MPSETEPLFKKEQAAAGSKRPSPIRENTFKAGEVEIVKARLNTLGDRLRGMMRKVKEKMMRKEEDELEFKAVPYSTVGTLWV